MDHRPPPPAVADGTGSRRPPPPVASGQVAAVRPIAWRAVPIVLVLALVNAPIAGWFAVWGIDHVNHCDDPALTAEQSCGLGFAVLIPIGWAVTAAIALGVVGLGFLRLPRWAVWSLGLVAIAAMWATNLATLSAYRPRL